MRRVEAQDPNTGKRTCLRYEQRQRKAPKEADGRTGEVRRWRGQRNNGQLITEVRNSNPGLRQVSAPTGALRAR